MLAVAGKPERRLVFRCGVFVSPFLRRIPVSVAFALGIRTQLRALGMRRFGYGLFALLNLGGETRLGCGLRRLRALLGVTNLGRVLRSGQVSELQIHWSDRHARLLPLGAIGLL